MIIKTNAKEIIAKNEKRINALQRNPRKVAYHVAKVIRDIAKAYAPKKSGSLEAGIIARATQNGATVYAYDPKHRVKSGANRNWLAWWADARVPFRYKQKPGLVFKAPQVVWYGKGKLVSGNEAKWSARPGYFTRAVNRGRREFGKSMTKAVRASMSGLKI